MTTRNHARFGVACVFPLISLAIAVGCTPVETSDTVVAAETTLVTPQSTVKGAVNTAAPSTSTTVKSQASGTTALQVLATIAIMNENGAGYDRDLFKHWIDADGDRCDTREEVLIAESLSPAQVDAYGCKVLEGDWISPFDNVLHTFPGGLDVDHMVPLKEAWDSGAWAWTPDERRSFANDLSDRRSLIAVTAGVNRSKGDKDPSNWLPPNSEYLCTYVSDWVVIKAHWNLNMDQSEHGRIRKILTTTCVDTASAPWGTRGSASNTTTPPRVVQTVPPSESTSTPVGSDSGVRQVSPVRCKKIEFGQTGEYNGIPYVCSDTRANGAPYATNYFFWRPA
jgi:hypothetical protein